MSKPGKLFVLIGPSGSGKGTLLKELLQREENLFLSVSATTRAPRPGEIHGVSYFFLSKEEFETQIAQGGMLEYAGYCNNYYGTPKDPVLERISAGEHVILEIEVQGARQVRDCYKQAVLIFIMPPSLEELKRRLTERNTEDREAVEARLAVAEEEMAFAASCDYVVINDTVSEAVERLRTIFAAEETR